MFFHVICGKNMIMNVTLKWFDNEGSEVTHDFPGRYEVCDTCEGHGSHLTESIGSHAYTAEEFRESFDEEEAEEYFTRGGRYDVACRTCCGQRVVLAAVPVGEMSPTDKKLYEAWAEHEEERIRDLEYSAAERAAECGYNW